MPASSTSPEDRSLPPAYRPVEELGFVDLALMLLRWRWVVVACLLLAWGLTGVRLARTVPRYESTAWLKIGRSRISAELKPIKEERDRLLEPAEVLAIRVKEEFGLGSRLSQLYQRAAVTGTWFDKDADELLRLTARADSPASARLFLADVCAAIIARHAEIYAPERRALEQRIDQLRQRLAERDEVSEASDAEPATAAVRQLARIQARQQRLTLERELADAELQALSLQTQPTQLLVAATENPRPVEPQWVWSLALATGLGAAAGSLAAFACQFLWVVRRTARGER